jgi:hypothetical protein
MSLDERRVAYADTTAWSTCLQWLPCQGSMSSGSIIYGYANVGPDFSDACLPRMAGDQGPWESEPIVAATALAGVAWLTLVFGLRWQLRTKAVAALPGLATLALAGAVAIGDAGRGQESSLPGILLLSIELSAVVAWSRSWPGQWRPQILAYFAGGVRNGALRV